jgi:hypothetical protein
MTCCSSRTAGRDSVSGVAPPEARKTDSRLAARCAAIASFGAAVIHIAAAPMHWREWLPAGVFFVALALFQLIWAAITWSRPMGWLLTVGILVNGAAVALWVTSRTAGPPVGPFAGQPEAVDTAGICALLLQCYVVMGAAWAWMRSMEAHQVPAFGRAAVLLGANTVMAGAVTVGLASLFQGGHQHHHGTVEVQAEHHVMPEHHPPAAGSEPASAPVTDMGLQTGDGVAESLLEAGADQVPVTPDALQESPEESGAHHHDHP